MAEPRRDPETGGRSLAEILREAGIESPTRGRRRRWDDMDDTGIRQRRPEADGDTGGVGGRPYGRRMGDLYIAGQPADRAAEPSTAAIPGLRPSGKPSPSGAPATSGKPSPLGTPATSGKPSPSGKPDVPAATAETGIVRERRPEERRGEDRRRAEWRPDDRQGDRRSADRRAPERRAEAGRAEERRLEDRRVEDRRVEDRRVEDRRVEDRRAVEPRPDRRATDRKTAAPPVQERLRERVPAPAAPPADNPSTGPIPVVADEAGAGDAESTPQGSALAWLRFAGELVIALAAGVGIYFLFTVIWEMLPYLAVVVAPLAVTGLVAGVGAYRHKVHRGPVGPKLLAVLVFAGTLLTVAPAAGLLGSG